jgi:hypothetical protein
MGSVWIVYGQCMGMEDREKVGKGKEGREGRER